MACFGKLTRLVGCASLALTLPMLAAATGPDERAEATYLISSGRAVNVVGDTASRVQSDARAAIWALTQQAEVPLCEGTGSSKAACFGTFQIGAKK